MPHDRNNTPLKVGDKVQITGVITELQPDEDFCNVTVETGHGRRPDGQKERICINSGAVERIGRIVDAGAGDNVNAASR